MYPQAGQDVRPYEGQEKEYEAKQLNSNSVAKEKRAISQQMLYNSQSLTQLEIGLGQLVEVLGIVLPNNEPTTLSDDIERATLGSSQLYFSLTDHQDRIDTNARIIRYLTNNVEL